MKKVLIDSDICLDSFTGRFPYSVNADKLLQAVEDGKLNGVVSGEPFSNIYYVLREFSSHQKAVRLLNQLEKIVVIGTISPEVVQQALSSNWRDFEDALQYYCAIREGCDAVITRNTPDFKKASIPVYSPQECLEII